MGRIGRSHIQSDVRRLSHYQDRDGLRETGRRLRWAACGCRTRITQVEWVWAAQIHSPRAAKEVSGVVVSSAEGAATRPKHGSSCCKNRRKPADRTLGYQQRAGVCRGVQGAARVQAGSGWKVVGVVGTVMSKRASVFGVASAGWLLRPSHTTPSALQCPPPDCGPLAAPLLWIDRLTDAR
jgi:hypothetical protein